MASQDAEEAKKLALLISNLPKVSISSTNEEYAFYQYKGFWWPLEVLEGVLRIQHQNSPDELNKISPSNIILCSLPKSGTTWLKSLAFSIVTRTRFDPNSNDHPLLSSFPHDLIPYMEWHRNQPLDTPLLATHMPYSALSEKIVGSSSSFGCKIVYICRNPKAVLVSLWHFMLKIWPTKEPIPLDKVFDLFCQGVSFFGPYWDHTLGYWKASLEYPNRVLFLKYEDLMEDGVSHVRRLTEFMGCPFSEEEESLGLITRIVDICSFESLSNMEVNKPGKFHRVGADDTAFKVPNSIMFRKAKVEDWSNYLTEEMANKLDEISLEKFGKFGLTM